MSKISIQHISALNILLKKAKIVSPKNCLINSTFLGSNQIGQRILGHRLQLRSPGNFRTVLQQVSQKMRSIFFADNSQGRQNGQKNGIFLKPNK
jgi:hypothetical protein